MNQEIFETLLSYNDDSLRDYQKENKTKIYKAWQSVNSVMLQMPTGTGKTRLFCSILKDIHNYSATIHKAHNTLVLAHRSELIDQISDTLTSYGLANGIIQSGDRERKRYNIQVASVPTLIKRLDKWSAQKRFDFIIVDEAHHILAESYRKIIRSFPDAKLLGVTATPVRLSGEGFSDVFDELIISPSVKEFINQGYLSDYKFYSVRPQSEIQQRINSIKHFNNGDYAEKDLEEICDNNHIRAQIVETYQKYANGKKGIVYAINQRHCTNLCKAFKDAGIRAEKIDSNTPIEEREDILERFKHNKIDILINVNIFTEGFDCPDIEFIQLARPTMSLALYLQQIGRGLRITTDKEECIFLDNVGLYNRFGFPSSPRKWEELFKGKEKNKTDKKIEAEEDKTETEGTNSGIKRTRESDLSEGNEKVYLINTSDELLLLLHRFDAIAEDFSKIEDEFKNTSYIYADKVKNNEDLPYRFHIIRCPKNDLRYVTHVVELKGNTKEEKEISLEKLQYLFPYSIMNPETKEWEFKEKAVKDLSELKAILDERFDQKIRSIFEKYMKKIRRKIFHDHDDSDIGFLIYFYFYVYHKYGTILKGFKGFLLSCYIEFENPKFKELEIEYNKDVIDNKVDRLFDYCLTNYKFQNDYIKDIWDTTIKEYMQEHNCSIDEAIADLKEKFKSENEERKFKSLELYSLVL